MASGNTGYASGIGVAGSVATSILGTWAQNKQIKEANRIAKEQWYRGLQAVRDQISTAFNRTQKVRSDILRDRIRSKMAVRSAAASAKGTRRVQAAQLGIQGRRASRLVTSDIERAEGQELSDADINAQTQLTTLHHSYTDSANAAIANLNSWSPVAAPTTGFVAGSIAGLNAGLDTYNSLSQNQKSDLKSLFTFKNTPTQAVDLNKQSFLDKRAGL